MRRALVLAGGGLAGIAWETGVLRGIADADPSVADALVGSDVLAGTSAGSAVAAQIGSGASLDELFDRQLRAESGEIHPGTSIDSVAELFLSALLLADATKEQKLQHIGAIAAGVQTLPEALRRDVIATRLPSPHWPERDLRITAIDVETGELVVFTRDSGVELVDAVAASCAVPGAWPPVTIGARRYMDGGVGSSVNMSAVGDCRSAVVLVPAAENAPSPWEMGPAAEIAAFPGVAAAVFADAAALAAFGPDPLEPACRASSARAGRAQGRRVAARVARALGL